MNTVKAGMIQPRYGRYGISGFDVIITGMECLFFRTRRLAREWMDANGYEVVG